MKEVSLIFPHQLFKTGPLINSKRPVFLIEEYLFFHQYRFHKQKLVFHRASMRNYRDFLEARQIEVHYVPSNEPDSDIRKLLEVLHKQGVRAIHYIDPTDNWLEKRIVSGSYKCGFTLKRYESPLFLNNSEQINQYFQKTKTGYHQTKFYIGQRKKLKILIDETGGPAGGKWTFDTENRKRYPKGKLPPKINYPDDSAYFLEACDYVNREFGGNPGELPDKPRYPLDHHSANLWLEQFLVHRFYHFGSFEDAIVAKEEILNHSVISPLLNVGLLEIHEVVNRTIEFASIHEIPLNSTEGFIRQVIGWREFLRGIYQIHGSYQRTHNFWGFTRSVPNSFYSGTTGIAPIDITVRKVLKTGYCHHIERLMVLGNFMQLCEFHPDEVYQWFMELFIDAYDWVMIPNVYGMSQFADGGLMTTKPYISGSNYLRKMSDYEFTGWENTWDALFWRFLYQRRDYFSQNPRLAMLLGTFNKMSGEKQQALLTTADQFLTQISGSENHETPVRGRGRQL